MLTVSWMNRTMIKAYRSGLSKMDLYALPDRDQGRTNAERLQRIWNDEQETAREQGRPASLAKAVVKFIKTRFILSCVLIMVSVILQFMGPVRNHSFPRL